MDVREKLVDIVCDATQIYGCIYSCNHPPCTMVRGIVDALIENGITLQEWISVDDRLPEDDSDALAYSRNGEEGRIYPANYAKGVWFDCIFNTPATDTTTHWMPLPQPPKGE